jgi:hypothetical protein
MGLWQLDPASLDRRPTLLVEAYADLIATAAHDIGTCN